MAMRRNKTYEQQKKFYDGSNNYESLGALFFDWLTSGYRPQSRCKMCTEKAQRNVRNTLWKTSSTFATRNNSISSSESSISARSEKMERSANRGALPVQDWRPHNINNLKERI